MPVKAYFHITANGKDITDRIKSFDYEMSNEKDNLLNLKIRPEKSLVTIDDDDLSVGNAIEFFWGWVGGKISPKRYAKISDIEVDYGRTETTMTIKCLDKGNRSKKVVSAKVWKKMRLDEIVQAIAIKNNLQYSIQLTNKVWDSVPQANRSDYELIQYLARREPPGNWICYFDGDTINLEQRNIGKAAAYYIEWGDPASKIMSIKAAYRESSQDPAVSSSDVKTFDPKTLKKDTATATDADKSTGKFSFNQNGTPVNDNTGTKTYVPSNVNVPQRSDISSQNGIVKPIVSLKKVPRSDFDPNAYYKATGAKYVVPDIKDKRMDSHAGVDTAATKKKLVQANKLTPEAKVKATTTTPGGKEEAKAKADSLASDTKLKVLEVDITMMGDPDWKPNDLFTLAGVAKRHGGNWYIKTITHSIKRAGDYTMVAKGSKNGTSKPVGTDKKEKEKEKVNDKPGTNDVIKYDVNAIEINDAYGKKGRYGGFVKAPLRSDIGGQNGVGGPPVLKSNYKLRGGTW